MPDFSTYVTIRNETPDNLVLASQSIVEGHWSKAPPDSIDAGSSAQIQLTDNTGTYGTQAYVTYRLDVPNGPSAGIHLVDPTSGCNVLTAKSTDPRIITVSASEVAQQGHPISGSVAFRKATFDTATAGIEDAPWAEVGEQAANADVMREFYTTEKPSKELYAKVAKYLAEMKNSVP